MSYFPRVLGRMAVIGLAVALACATGCGESIKTHPVRGKVVVEGGDIKKLEGTHVEFRLDSDPSIRSSGEIKEDGSFELMTYYKGRMIPGAPEGTHTARIVISGDLEEEDEPVKRDDDEAPDFQPESTQKKSTAPLPVHARFLRFTTSKLTYTVPTDGEITVQVSTK
ncbi:MAG: hypothetical protein L0241_17745 [Planctomycetia bacterium]|nr:hypothetical protein [Planctomycetia bacterium]